MIEIAYKDCAHLINPIYYKSGVIGYDAWILEEFNASVKRETRDYILEFHNDEDATAFKLRVGL